MNVTQILFISLLACLFVDADVNPCDDFYTYACEEFMRDTQVPEKEGFVDHFSLLDGDVFNKLTTVLTEENPEDSHNEKLPKIFYRGCLRSDSDVEELQEILEDLHGFPVNSEWDASSYDWIQALFKMEDLGLPTDFFFKMEAQTYDGRTVIWIISPYEKIHISNDTEGSLQTAAYYKYMVDAAELLGADRQTAEADMMDVLMFENEIEELKPYKNNFERPESKFFTLAELIEVEPRFPWLQYINTFLEESDYINDTQPITANFYNYLTGVMDLIQKTDKRTLANFLNWKFVDFAFNYLNEELKKVKATFLHPEEYTVSEKMEVNECLIHTVIKFGDITSLLYLNKYFTKEEKQIVAEMVNAMKDEVKQMINETEWMDEETREEAHKKLDLLKVEVGYPDGIFQEDVLKNKYEQLTLTPGSFLKMNLNASKVFQRHELRRLYLTIPWYYENYYLLERVMLPVPSYHERYNRIAIPAALLQPTIFNGSNSKEDNYGSAGFAIGRQFHFAFTTSYYNPLGEYESWYTDATKEAFNNKSQCVVSHYEDLVEEYLEEEQIFVEDYQAKVLADLSGARVAYGAYQRAQKEFQEISPANEGHSLNQLFWLGLANFHCAKNDLPSMQVGRLFYYSYKRHLPGKARMNGIAMNNEEFSRDWNCESGSPMNPQEKCLVW